MLTLLGGGCPVPAIVAAYGLDERTVGRWLEKAGQHAKQVQAHFVSGQELDLGQVQGDEMYIKTQYGAAWVATAISVFPRFIVWAAASAERNRSLIDQVIEKVWSAVDPYAAILWAVDGFSAWKSAILKTFRLPLRTGKRGRPKLIPAPELHLVQVVKQRVKGRLVAIERRLVHGPLALPKPFSLPHRHKSVASTPPMSSASMPPSAPGFRAPRVALVHPCPTATA
ncbi:MAG: hypothetical protein R3A44_05725 [Caldilineaceae bacterium]